MKYRITIFLCLLCLTAYSQDGCRMPSACNYDPLATTGDADLCHWNCYSTCSDASSCNFQEPITTGSAQLQCALVGAIWDTQLLSCHYEPTQQECSQGGGIWNPYDESCTLMNDPWDPNGPVGIIQAEATALGVAPPSSWVYPAEMYWQQVVPFGYCYDQGYYGSCLCANEAAANPYYSNFEMQTCSDGSASWTGHGTGSNTVTINYPCTQYGFYDGGTGSSNITIYIPSGMEHFHLHNSTGWNVYNVYYNSATTAFTWDLSTGWPTLNTFDNYISEPACGACIDQNACNYNPNGTDDDGSCDYETCAGCTDPNACNYDSTATNDDESCEVISCAGCTDSSACNYDPNASIDDGSCSGSLGCTDSSACNYDSSADCDDGSCLSLDECGECGGSGTIGCIDSSACNYDADADCDDGSCTYPGCTNISACNYDSAAGCEDGSCEYLTCRGCTGAMACNYDPEASIDDESCDYTACAGCTTPLATNYDSTATIDDGSCVFEECDVTIDNQAVYEEAFDAGVASVECPPCANSDCPGDFTADGYIGVDDILSMLSLYDTSCSE